MNEELKNDPTIIECVAMVFILITLLVSFMFAFMNFVYWEEVVSWDVILRLFFSGIFALAILSIFTKTK